MNDAKPALRIGFLNTMILQDKRSSWTITNRHMTQALQKFCGEVSQIGPIELKAVLAGKIVNKSIQLFFKKGFMYYHSFFLAKRFARIASQVLKKQSFDVIVAPSCATEIAFLETDIPIVLIEDATFALLHNYYPQYRNLLKRSVYEVHALEELAMKKASLILYTSEWAAQSAIEFYHADKNKVHAFPFGANFANPPAKEIALQKQKPEICRLFFLGGEWERKGGAIAFETLLKLEEMGVQAELIICGCIPPKEFVHHRMKVFPFLSKSDETQRKELERLFETSAFMILPTRSDCVPMVFGEAGAYGLPVITTDTGGVPGVIRNGENGFMLSLNAGGSEYAEVIAKVYNDDLRYMNLVRSSREAFDTRLNWDAWGYTVKNLLNELLSTAIKHPDISKVEKSPQISSIS